MKTKHIVSLVLALLMMALVIYVAARETGTAPKTTEVALTTTEAPVTTTVAPTTEEPTTTAPISAEEAALRALLEAEISREIGSFDYDDFDGNGTKEAFAYVAGELWFVDADGAQQLEEGVGSFGGDIKTVTFSGHKFLVVTAVRAGFWHPIGFVDILGVKDGKPHAYIVSEEGGWFEQVDDTRMTIWCETWDGISFTNIDGEDGIPHLPSGTIKPYWFYWDGTRFREYGGVEISESQLRKCEGAAKILDDIKAQGYTIDDIYYRGNDMININYHSKHAGIPNEAPSQKNNYYTTLELNRNTGKVKLVGDIATPEEYVIIYREPEDKGAGIYRKALIPSIAVYPTLPAIFTD